MMWRKMKNVTIPTWLFALISFGKHSVSWKVLDICELCALLTDSQKICSLNTYNKSKHHFCQNLKALL